MKIYKRPRSREIILDTEETFLAALSEFNGNETIKDGDGDESLSKGNSGWDDWEE